MKLVDEKQHEAVIGAEYVDFRAERHTLLGVEKPHKPSSTGRVITDKGSFFPGVIGLTWIEREDHA